MVNTSSRCLYSQHGATYKRGLYQKRYNQNHDNIKIIRIRMNQQDVFMLRINSCQGAIPLDPLRRRGGKKPWRGHG